MASPHPGYRHAPPPPGRQTREKKTHGRCSKRRGDPVRVTRGPLSFLDTVSPVMPVAGITTYEEAAAAAPGGGVRRVAPRGTGCRTGVSRGYAWLGLRGEGSVGLACLEVRGDIMSGGDGVAAAGLRGAISSICIFRAGFRSGRLLVRRPHRSKPSSARYAPSTTLDPSVY